MDKLDEITIIGCIFLVLMGLTIVIFNEFILNSRLLIGMVGCFMFFWTFFVMLKQNEANCDKTKWSE